MIRELAQASAAERPYCAAGVMPIAALLIRDSVFVAHALMDSTAHAIDKPDRMLGRRVVAPANVSVRPYQYQAPFIKRGDRGIVDRDEFERHAA